MACATNSLTYRSTSVRRAKSSSAGKRATKIFSQTECRNPCVLLTSFKVFDQERLNTLNLSDLQSTSLTPQENFFTFDFASANFSQPEKNEYAARLSWLLWDWQMLRLCAVRCRTPTFRLCVHFGSENRARNRLWNEPGLRLEIEILPPFWATWWFRALMFLAVAGGGFGGYKYRIAQIRREESLKTAFQKRIAEVEMTALRVQMNPHFVFNCLNSINRFILVNEPESASVYLTKFFAAHPPDFGQFALRKSAARPRAGCAAALHRNEGDGGLPTASHTKFGSAPTCNRNTSKRRRCSSSHLSKMPFGTG